MFKELVYALELRQSENGRQDLSSYLLILQKGEGKLNLP